MKIRNLEYFRAKTELCLDVLLSFLFSCGRVTLLFTCTVVLPMNSIGEFKKRADVPIGIAGETGPYGTYNTYEWVDLSDEWSVEVFRVKKETFGNRITLGGQNFYTYSSNWDRARYLNDALDIELVDINGDGLKDLIISGTVMYLDKSCREEPLEGHVLWQENVLFIYQCDLTRQKFTLLHKKASFDIEMFDARSSSLSKGPPEYGPFVWNYEQEKGSKKGKEGEVSEGVSPIK
ncbi:MAG: hypothetical protein MUC65_07910 [Pontiellaceae bacterium]|nr:hypothetical protein [Pontiellaceae bacterium]